MDLYNLPADVVARAELIKYRWKIVRFCLCGTEIESTETECSIGTMWEKCRLLRSDDASWVEVWALFEVDNSWLPAEVIVTQSGITANVLDRKLPFTSYQKRREVAIWKHGENVTHERYEIVPT